MNKQLNFESKIDTNTGNEIGTNLKFQIIRNAFLEVDADVEVKIPHNFVTRVPIVLVASDGNNGTIYLGDTEDDNANIYRKSKSANNPVTIFLI